MKTQSNVCREEFLLALFQKMGKPSFPWRYFGMSVDKPDSAAAENMCRTGCAVVIALQNAPLVPEFLAGETGMVK
jgi:hypothetical protein